MGYVSIDWLAWMAGTTALFWATPAAWRLWALGGATFAFLALKDPISCAILLAATVLTRFLTRGEAFGGRQAAVQTFSGDGSHGFIPPLSTWCCVYMF